MTTRIRAHACPRGARPGCPPARRRPPWLADRCGIRGGVMGAGLARRAMVDFLTPALVAPARHPSPRKTRLTIGQHRSERQCHQKVPSGPGDRRHGGPPAISRKGLHRGDQASDPVGHRLSARRPHACIVRRPGDDHEHVGFERDALGVAENRHDLPGKVGEPRLAGAVLLAHRALECRGPVRVPPAELRRVAGVLAAVGLDVRLPGQLQCHAFATQVAVQHPRSWVQRTGSGPPSVQAAPTRSRVRRRRAVRRQPSRGPLRWRAQRLPRWRRRQCRSRRSSGGATGRTPTSTAVHPSICACSSEVPASPCPPTGLG
ncbi:hypothetical protein PSP31121_05313 [Pandoraea sputorum]|uniref:Uncharacterized protein n=1 Tax=Pandoraea sputorum TaxID=93222 RepID=A0A5E5BM44_9BURK|nr:hypothetical protein PSP31121_05313 [Pandoraea sputorum]